MNRNLHWWHFEQGLLKTSYSEALADNESVMRGGGADQVLAGNLRSGTRKCGEGKKKGGKANGRNFFHELCICRRQ